MQRLEIGHEFGFSRVAEIRKGKDLPGALKHDPAF